MCKCSAIPNINNPNFLYIVIPLLLIRTAALWITHKELKKLNGGLFE